MLRIVSNETICEALCTRHTTGDHKYAGSQAHIAYINDLLLLLLGQVLSVFGGIQPIICKIYCKAVPVGVFATRFEVYRRAVQRTCFLL